MGWIILYASAALKDFYRPLLRGIFNVILMPNTVMQASLPEILRNPVNNVHINGCMELMRINQTTLKEALKDKSYCTFGHSAGALYATIIIDLQKLTSKFNNSSI
jgi:aspartate/methionine/tyrosine aminotransferase